MVCRKNGLWLCLFAFLLMSSLSVMAQDRESRRPGVKFSVTDGRSDNYVYYLPDNPGDYTRILSILDDTVPVYNTLRGNIPWLQQIVVVFMGTSSPGITAFGRTLPVTSLYVARKEPAVLFDASVCSLRIFNGWESVPDLESVIARELFHCVQAEFSDIMVSTYDDPAQSWWINGTAEWAASLVYPAQYPSGRQINFDQRRDVTKSGYEALYFWEFAATSEGMGSIDYVRNEFRMIATRKTDDDLFLGLPIEPTDLFHNWIKALHKRSLTIPPVVDLTNSDTVASQSGSATINLPRFSGDFVHLIGFDVLPGNIAFVKATGITASNYAVSVETASGLQRLTADTAFEFCPSATGNMILISRGRGGDGDTSGFTLEWGQTPSKTPCAPAVPTPAPAAAGSACYVGDWQVVGLPKILGNMDSTGYVFSLAEDGTLTGVYAIASDTMSANYPMTGTYKMVPDVSDSTRFTAKNMKIVYGAGTATSLDDGQDLSDVVLETLNTSGSMPASFPVVCKDNQMTWTVAKGYVFTLSRQ